MKKVGRNLLGSAVVLVACTGCGQSPQGLIVDEWNCNEQIESVDLSTEMQFVSTGHYSVKAQAEWQESSNKFTISLLEKGSWALEGDDRGFTTENVMLRPFVMNEADLPNSDSPENLKTRFLETPPTIRS